MAEGKELMNMSNSFVQKIVKEGVGNPDFSVTPAQKNLIQGYFVAMDHTLTQQDIPWKDVIVDYKLAQDLMVCAQMGFDMRAEGMLYAVPRRDNHAGGKQRFTIQKGYKGRVFMAQKYALGNLLDISVHLVYENDEFIPHFKDANHTYDTFEFNPPKNCFVDRGKMVGGFAYISYENPAQNKLVVMSKADIDKRKSMAMSTKFWDKWPEEMAIKTLYIQAAKAVPLDPSKIDDNFRAAQVMESAADDLDHQDEIISAQAEGETIDASAALNASRSVFSGKVEPPMKSIVEAEKTAHEPKSEAHGTSDDMPGMEF
ncbi:RecT family protein [Acidaminococcus fermentans]|uniref:recombinase RecT n=1 Tax=Acidaminococcus fermentans TaxID=905 RepID=UPI0008ECD644|nr:recombinase RecT [Acidaminococcus fermentans]SFO62697.1 RecT family protein [Acidaminococcus fermentans]